MWSSFGALLCRLPSQAMAICTSRGHASAAVLQRDHSAREQISGNFRFCSAEQLLGRFHSLPCQSSTRFTDRQFDKPVLEQRLSGASRLVCLERRIGVAPSGKMTHGDDPYWNGPFQSAVSTPEFRR